MSEPAGFTREAVEALSRRLGEPDWMLRKRLDAFEQWTATPYPSAERDEDWRRTDIRRIKFDRMSALVEPNGRALEPVADGDDVAAEVAFVDGRGEVLRIDDDLRAAGVLVCTLAEAVRDRPELVQRWFMTCVEPGENKFTLLHAAFWQDGLFVYVPPGVELPKPIMSTVTLSRGGVSWAHHSLVVVDERAQASIVEMFSGGGDKDAVSYPVVEVIAERDARVHYSGVQNWDESVYEFGTKRALLAAGAQADLCIGALGGKVSKTFVGGTLAGEGSTCHLLGLYFPGKGQHVDQTTHQDHRVANCTSNLLFKGALADFGRSVFRGVISVEPEAQRTDAYQKNNNLLLGEDARADSMPVLEIEADDVKCSHGATLGYLDEEDLFYLMSRGLSRDNAEMMVINGFFQPVLELIPLEAVRRRLASAIEQRVERQTTAHLVPG